MTQALPALTTQAPAPAPLSSYLETIIDKKVAGAALSCFEALVHWFLTTFTCCNSAYKERYLHKLDITVPRVRFGLNQLQDLTPSRIVSIEIVERIASPWYGPIDYLTLNGMKVIFSAHKAFTSLPETNHVGITTVTVEEAGDHHIRIAQKHENMGRVDSNQVWHVDTNVQYTRFAKTIEDVQEQEPVYVVEEARPEIKPEKGYLIPIENQ